MFQMSIHQLEEERQADNLQPLPQRLIEVLSEDMNFHAADSRYASHTFHSFPAKFPPQLPKKLINTLTSCGDVVLDPMMGSGTTVLEAYLNGRVGIGFDIDPLALKLAKVKTTSLDAMQVGKLSKRIIERARHSFKEQRQSLIHELENRWDAETHAFIDYWFARETQLECLALINEIEKVEEFEFRAFFEMALSAIIITKSGGISLAFDLAHTRPHRAKIVLDPTGDILSGTELHANGLHSKRFTTKALRSPIAEFERRIQQNLGGLIESNWYRTQHPLPVEPHIALANAQDLPLSDRYVDLIVTSPPYASNAIDYMRAHKFSLVWLGYPIALLERKRKEYIGGETTTCFPFELLPTNTQRTVNTITAVDQKKGRVLHRYFSEMTRALKEMFRVLKPGKAAVVVVGSSVMRGIDTTTHECLAEIGRQIGFEVPIIGVRNLDRNRRMMPAGSKIDRGSQIQKRMHDEYVIGFYKPDT